MSISIPRNVSVVAGPSTLAGVSGSRKTMHTYSDSSRERVQESELASSQKRNLDSEGGWLPLHCA